MRERFWPRLFCVVLLFLAACGGGSNSSSDNPSETGSIVFQVEWQEAPISTWGSSIRADLDCTAAGVSTVEVRVYDENDALLIAGGPWSCSAHSGTITGVRAGSNRKIVILAKDSGGDNIYRGQVQGVTVTGGQTYNAGKIPVTLFNCATLSTPANASTVTNCDFSFLWGWLAGFRYEIQVDDSSSFTSINMSQTVDGGSYTPSTLIPGTYYWRVRTLDAYGNGSKWSDPWTCTVSTAQGQPPSAPTGVGVTAGCDQMAVSWNSVSGAASYNIYWATVSGVTKSTGTKIANVNSPYTHLGLTNGITYYYIVTAVNSCGETESSQVGGTTGGAAPPAPTGVTHVDGDRQVTISWSSVLGATSYNIYWATVSGVTKSTGTKIANVTSPYTHTGRTNGTTYYYVVTAVSSCGESTESSQVGPAIPGTPPSPPSGVVAKPATSQVTISWNSVSGATSYNIYWSLNPGVTKTTGTKIATVTSPFAHTGRTNGTTYYYVVTAVNGYGESAESSEVWATAQYIWAKTYGGTGVENAWSVQQTSDGGYIVGGWTNSFGAGGYDGWVLKLNADGTVAWEKTVGGSGSDFVYSIRQTADGGYIAGVATSSFGAGGYDYWIVKLKSDGTVSWTKNYGGTGNDFVLMVEQTSDGGFIASGYTQSFGAGSADIWLLKLDPTGVAVWQKTYGGTGWDAPAAIQQTSDGGYILAGQTDSSGAGSADIWVLKLNTDGTVAWQKTYGGTGEDSATAIQQTIDGGYIVAGYTYSFGVGNNSTDFWVLKLNTDGTVAWQKTYGGTGEDSARSIRQTADGGYIIAGFTSSYGAGGSDIWILKLNSDGTVAWQKTYGGTGQDHAYSIRQTADGGYIVAGDTSSFGSGNSDIWVMKIGPDGSLGCGFGVGTSAVIFTPTVSGSNTAVTGNNTSISLSVPAFTPPNSNASVNTQCQ